MTTIQFSRAWCDECYDDCYWSYNEQTGINQHIGSSTLALAAALQPLREHGYYISHRRGTYTATLYKAAPLALDWQLALDLADHHESIDIDQDW